eukprot:NODE_162_length_14959_cov_1.379610.p10 type:complete len:132 gc:universal NODE_162_length_14959_cov_1.379610:1202-1597(+)
MKTTRRCKKCLERGRSITSCGNYIHTYIIKYPFMLLKITNCQTLTKYKPPKSKNCPLKNQNLWIMILAVFFHIKMNYLIPMQAYLVHYSTNHRLLKCQNLKPNTIFKKVLLCFLLVLLIRCSLMQSRVYTN